ncbi:MAG: nitroreductase family protein [Acidobacteriota bacterium]
MNPVVEAIVTRRSIRGGFSSSPVDREVLENIVRCGLAAPSSKNARPWRFHVVTDCALLMEVSVLVEQAEGRDEYVPCDPTTGRPWETWRSSVDESAAVLKAAPAAIFVENLGIFSRGRATLIQAAPAALAASIVGYSFEVMGVGAAVQNMWIAAVSLGLGGVFLGDVLVAETEIRRKLGIPCELAGALVLGYPAQGTVPAATVRAELDPDRVRWLTPS